MSQNWEGGVPPPSPSLEESPMPSKKGRQHVVGSTAPTQPESATCSAAGRGVNHAAGMGGTSTGVLEHPHGRKDPAPRETSWPRGSQGPPRSRGQGRSLGRGPRSGATRESVSWGRPTGGGEATLLPPHGLPPPTLGTTPNARGRGPGGGVRGGRGREGAGVAYRAMSLAAFYYKPSEGVGVTPGSLENSAAGFPRRFSNL